ncbi:hypothetical protein [Aquabacterium sp.]|uniref:hypothetical protein n=1 Tax=Aquabacterium sp. TaxID=1872578 RepID=UPI0019C2D494|nr:hypothetical protein [Aquabacterium sp.]MBC7700942.1 hypothetical protein [Aquabacterium sp.]
MKSINHPGRFPVERTRKACRRTSFSPFCDSSDQVVEGAMGSFVKFNRPVVANGKVFVGGVIA